jgi:hypothetical protein
LNGAGRTGGSSEDAIEFVPWRAKKVAILQEFTTDELVGITVVCIAYIDT